MKAITDPTNALARGLAAIRTQYQVPDRFPDEVLTAAAEAARRKPTQHVDRTDRAFVTLDPASSTDLDQAFMIERAGTDLLLHYAIADVAWFVDDDGSIDREAWRRGATLYLPDGKAGLYPPVLSEGAASLLPDGPRPAVVFIVRVAPDGGVKLAGAEGAIIHSRAKLGYATVHDADLPDGFVELAERITAAEQRRGAARVDPPEQEVTPVQGGGYELLFRERFASEDRNAALSLATNLALADLMQAHGAGLFRVMPGPEKSAIRRLRHSATALDIDWAKDIPLTELERRLDPANPKQAAMMMAIRRASHGAAYVPFKPGETPWHSAMAATYAHGTAPLRRLADRYVVRAALAIANGQAVPDIVSAAFTKLPKVMAAADTKGAQVDRAIIDLAETVMLESRVGERFPAVVTDVDERGARVQLCGLPVIARAPADGAEPGDRIDLKLVATDAVTRQLGFARAA
ncbi:MAG: RNB domain-containing ribonuclease [Sphingomonas sp.]|uniref:RNB domain-containing ribonuclease n=1 Tax=Sphingomonas sp. TaxID=28214 RepID=UPI0017F90E57|nr:RNB domain-containing ribonuclease [Sphingomonas sp.]MBA3667485.1 RNB domain-containing ribonuclease [Sphingomonas sp.]